MSEGDKISTPAGGGHRGALLDVYATFRAEYLHALRVILDRASEIQFLLPAGLLIEPAAGGGVLLIATDGRTLGVFHDAMGHANKPFRAMLPKAFRERCAPPELPRFSHEGDSFCYEPPEWAQPGDVVITGVCAMLFGKMPHPSEEDEQPEMASVGVETGKILRVEDFRVDEAEPLKWRKIFKPRGEPREYVNVDPAMLEAFTPIVDLSRRRDDHDGGMTAIRFGGMGEPYYLQIKALPEFFGAGIPMVDWPPPDLPVFLGLEGARDE